MSQGNKKKNVQLDSMTQTHGLSLTKWMCCRLSSLDAYIIIFSPLRSSRGLGVKQWTPDLKVVGSKPVKECMNTLEAVIKWDQSYAKNSYHNQWKINYSKNKTFLPFHNLFIYQANLITEEKDGNNVMYSELKTQWIHCLKNDVQVYKNSTSN